MSVNIKSKKHLKREQVIPFSGEENFVVPRKGGFGMSDNEDYISVARANFSDNSYSNLTRISLDDVGGGTIAGSEGTTDNLLNGGKTNLMVDTTSGGGGGGGGTGSGDAKIDYATGGSYTKGGNAVVDYAPRVDELPLPTPDVSYSNSPNWRTATTCQELKDYASYLESYLAANPNLSPSDMGKYITESQGINMAIPIACAVSVSDRPKDTPIDYAPRGEDTPIPVEPPPPPPPPIEPAPPIDTPPPVETTPLPKYPDWNSLNCDELSSSIQVFDRKLSSGLYTPEAANLANNELAKAKSIYINKGCDVKAPPPPPIETPTPTGGGTIIKTETTFTPTFGGGGFGSSPSGGGGGDEVKEEPKKKDYSWLWLLLIVGGIYIATRKKKGVK